MASITTIHSLPPLHASKGLDSRRRRRTSIAIRCSSESDVSSSHDANNWMGVGHPFERRQVLMVSSVGLIADAFSYFWGEDVADASEFADMPALRGKDYGKSKMRYPDYMETQSGLQYKDLRVGDGPKPKMGETVVVDWDGYTIGYYGRIFEARNKTKGGSFEGEDKAFFKFKLGSQEVIPAFEEAVAGMSPGGIRREQLFLLTMGDKVFGALYRLAIVSVEALMMEGGTHPLSWSFPDIVIIVPPELGYPENDYNKSGPKPTTFSGQRALDFVLRNQGLIDKTLLFDIELVKVLHS